MRGAGGPTDAMVYVSTAVATTDVPAALGEHTDRPVLTAESVAAALDVLESNAVACIVSDHEPPAIDAIAFLETVRAQCPDLPFVILTDAGSERLASRAIRAKVTDYLVEDDLEDPWATVVSVAEEAISTYGVRRTLDREDDRIADVLAATLDPVLVVQDDAVVYANERAATLFERPRLALLDADPADLFAADLDELLGKVRSGTASLERRETSVAGPGGRRIPVEVTATAIEWRGCEAVLVIGRDVTAERERMAVLQRFVRAAEAAGHAVYITDAGGHIEYVNPAFEAVTGYSASDVLGRTPAVLSSGEMDDAYYEDLWETLLSGEVWEEEVVNRRQDGESYTAHQTISPILDESGEVDAFVAIQTDVTERKERERALHQYRQAVESSMDLLSAVNADYTVQFANERYREFHGVEDRSLRGEPLAAVIGADAFDWIRPKLDRALDGEVVEFEMTRTHPDEGERTLDIRYFPIVDDDGTIDAVGAAMRDITERIERIEKIRRLAEYRRVMSAVNEAIVKAEETEALLAEAAHLINRSDLFACTYLALVDGREPTFVCEEGNPEGDRVDFHTPAYFETVFEDDVTEFADVTAPPHVQHGHGTESHPGIAVAIRHEDEAYGVLTVHFAPGAGPDAQERQLLAEIAADLGFFIRSQHLDRARRERERETREQKRRYESLFESIRDALVVTDVDGTIEDCNRAFTDLFGYDPEDVEGEPTEVLFADDADAAEMERAFERTGVADFLVTIDYRTKAGGTFPGETSVTYLRNADDEMVGFIGLIRDVSERRDRIQQLQVIDRVLRHNLHNDMNVIQGYAQTIEEEGGPAVATPVRKIRETSRRLLRTVDKEREITAFLSEPPPATTIDLVDLVEGCVADARSQYPEAEFRTSLPEACPVEATPALGTAVGELLENAVVHADHDHPSVTVSVDRENGTATVTVADDGPLIPEMERTILTGEAEIGPLYHGSGLGLWLVNLIVRQSNGSLTFDENEPRGNLVSIRLLAE
ncbi:MAG: PAS domain S-box protein [Halanaeroarchaeum sp.]